MKKAIFVFILIIPYIIALKSPIQDGDPALYAEVSREIVINNNFFELKANNEIFYEKPPSFFWFQALFFKLFGINEISARIHLFISFILTLFFIYRITAIFYNRKTAEKSLMLSISTLAFFIMLIQPKIDLLLLCFLYGALWSAFEFKNKKNKIYLFLYLTFSSSGALTKGPIGILWPLFFVFIAFLFKFFNIKEVLYLTLISLLSIIPFITFLFFESKYAGLHAASYLGLKQTFGRFFMKHFPKIGDPLFLFHSFLWAFLPWTLIYIYGIIKNIKKFSKKEMYFLMITFLTLFVSSFERWKMPQHSFPALLGGIILTSLFIENSIPVTLYIISEIIIILFSFFITFLCFPSKINMFIFLIIIFIFVLSLFKKEKIFYLSIESSLLFFLLFFLLHDIIKFNGAVQIGKFLKNKNLKIYSLNTIKYYAIPFYSGKFVNYIYSISKLNKEKPDSTYLIIKKNDLKYLRNLKNYRIELLRKFPHFYTSKLKLKFLLKSKRKEILDTFYVYKIILKTKHKS